MPTTSTTPKKGVGIVLDCDGTIAKDTTSQLIDLIGGDSDNFWKEVDPHYKDGWDPPLYWIPELIQLSRDLNMPISNMLLTTMATKISFFQGVPEIFDRLKAWFKKQAESNAKALELKIYIVSSGLEDLLVRTSLSKYIDEIYGCTLDFDSNGLATVPKSAVTFTEKTRYIFSINKGISKKREREKPQLVNDFMATVERPVPLESMIYIGDGPTDIPCFSIIKRAGGQAIGIRWKRENAVKSMGITEPFSKNYRPRWGPFEPVYTENSDLVLTLKDLLFEMLKR